MPETNEALSWGRAHRFRQRVETPVGQAETARMVGAEAGKVLAFGRGRSYGDSCLNEDGLLIDTRRLDRFVSFDRETGLLVCEAGVTLADILALTAAPLSDGSYWFLPVTPGTKFVTIAGAIANDVHGKNHPHRGTLGRHIAWFDLLRSDAGLLQCSLQENAELFRATVGGLGLTGLIVRAAIQLVKVPNLTLEIEEVRMRNLDDYFRLAEESIPDWEYCAAWIDVLASGGSLGRGIYTRARHAAAGVAAKRVVTKAGPSVPFVAPGWLLNPLTLRLFNAAYSRKLMGRQRVRRFGPYDSAFYPLDAIGNWNRLYGPGGFYQYQCAIPRAARREAVKQLVRCVSEARRGSFLVVVKEFGPLESPGLLSFPIEGTTFALDFPNRGRETLDLLDRLDEITLAAGGRVYPAKDGRMSAATFNAGNPELDRFRRSLDPKFSSSFWRRTGGAEG